MTNETDGRDSDATLPNDPSRRGFVALSAAAGLVAAARTAEAAARAVGETEVEIKTADGVCDAVFIHPASGTHPVVLVWPDAFGLRPVFRELGKRLAAQGYAVLVPNPFYRSARAPVFTDVSGFKFQDPADRAKLDQLIGSMHQPGVAESDSRAYIGFLDAQRAVRKASRIGVQGYCMGGALTVESAAAVPQRVGAGASFHGGGLVTDKSDSPHLLAPKIRAHMYFAIAASDDARQPDAKDKLREAFAAARVPAQIEVYAGTKHGWCVPDMPPQPDGTPTYNKPDAERAWSRLLALYRSALA